MISLVGPDTRRDMFRQPAAPTDSQRHPRTASGTHGQPAAHTDSQRHPRTASGTHQTSSTRTKLNREYTTNNMHQANRAHTTNQHRQSQPAAPTHGQRPNARTGEDPKACSTWSVRARRTGREDQTSWSACRIIAWRTHECEVITRLTRYCTRRYSRRSTTRNFIPSIVSARATKGSAKLTARR